MWCAWCFVFGVLCLVLSVWCFVLGIRFLCCVGRCWLFVARRFPRVISCVLRFEFWLMCVGWYALFVVCVVIVVCCLLFVVCCALFVVVVRCSLLVVCCYVFVDWYVYCVVS